MHVERLMTRFSPIRRFRTLMLLLLAAAVAGPALADDLHLETGFHDLDGQAVSLADFGGQVVALNLWAVWCSPCIVEIPHLVRLQAEFSEGEATVIGLAVDSGSARAIRSFWVDRLEIDPVYPLWRGTAEEVAEAFDAHTYPTTLIIGHDGQVRERLLGLQTGEDLRAAIERHL